MYSSAWQRAMKVRRFPTFAWPETAPTRGSCSGVTSSAKVSRAKCVSASRKTKISCRGLGHPAPQRLGFAAVFLAQEADAPVHEGGALHFPHGLVLRAVVDHDHLKLAGVGGIRDGAQRGGDDLLLIDRRR